MTDSEKLFACSTSGCNMSFTNEDQLSVHKKKHDMMLNLNNNSKSAGFVADQTPTPTRFLKNCEEVGLFQDLQNVVNPFEETFRRAVEAGNTGTLIVSEAGITDDTLHTPHIFPYISDVLPANSQILSEDNVEVPLAEKDEEQESTIKTDECNSIKLSTNETQELMKDSTVTSAKDDTLPADIIASNTNVPIAPKLSQTQSTSHLSINGEEVQLLLKTADGKLIQLCATPVLEPSNISNTEQQTVIIKTEPALRCAMKLEPKKTVISRLSLAKMKLKQSLSKNAQNQKATDDCAKMDVTASAKKEGIKKTIDQLKKKDILERNRASSMRARAKRKEWIQELQRTVTNVNEANTVLQMEVKTLRKEVARLKALLLAHKDCPVTKSMQKGIILGPKIISVDNPEILTVPISANGVPVKRSVSYTTEIPSVPTKKSIMSITKNPVILPKMDCGTANLAIPNATIIKTLPALKIVGVNQFMPEKSEVTKQILIVQNQPRKLCEATSRQIIQINPNYEVENAASKSTGT
ncbi:PREDICTED: cyclic AMP-dependent transcription factor ATF-7 [Cyphomyrmex costatus]|uniref:cyclic AMP-dependent transcription factor ATF-7 n=1 Tax=Cyphomyrmex costatus TaxID=456900 RepID=UPI00085228E2|nr:PREDICTED: cyclic AMP-dependent transcription factor ATF-7 [Cyphomyrmex costatus]XP_018393911.1 PREDICTED: cyclic AMP-dependent transcription factor ATF-7 [Cyphomyrmex costatus]